MRLFNPFLAFLSKLAIICNGCFVFSLIVMFVPMITFPAALSNFVAVLGLEMAPVVSILLGMACLFFWVKKHTIPLPRWQTFVNLFMLLFQLIFIIA